MVTTRIQHHTPRDTPCLPNKSNWKLFLPRLPEIPPHSVKRPDQIRKTYQSFGNSISRSSGSQPVTLRCKYPGHPNILGSILNLDHPELFPPPRWTCSIRKTGKGIRRVKDVRHMHLWQQSSLQSYWLHQSCIHNIHISSIKYTCLIRSSRLSIFSIRFLSSFSSWDPNQQGARSMSRRNHHVDQVTSWVFEGNLDPWRDMPCLISLVGSKPNTLHETN